MIDAQNFDAGSLPTSVFLIADLFRNQCSIAC